MAEKAKTTKKTISIPLPFIIVVGAVIILALSVFIGEVGRNTVECTTEKCFDHEFAICHPATWAAQANYEIQNYKINGKTKSGACGVTFSNSITSNIHITCNFNNKLSFSDAQAVALNNIKKYDCRKT